MGGTLVSRGVLPYDEAEYIFRMKGIENRRDGQEKSSFLIGLFSVGLLLRKIRLIESNAKCCNLKIDLLRDFAAGVLSVWGPLPSYDLKRPPPPVTPCIRVYGIHTYSHREGKGGELTRE
jgi:hypothetical protein